MVKVEKDKNQKMFNRTEIKDTPFEVISLDKNVHFVVMGKWRLTENFKTKDEAVKDAQSMTWNRIITVMSLIADYIKDSINENQKTK